MCQYFLKSYHIAFEYLLMLKYQAGSKLGEFDLLYFCNPIKETPSKKKKKISLLNHFPPMDKLSDPLNKSLTLESSFLGFYHKLISLILTCPKQ